MAFVKQDLAALRKICSGCGKAIADYERIFLVQGIRAFPSQFVSEVPLKADELFVFTRSRKQSF
jgi:hypothetical protein